MHIRQTVAVLMSTYNGEKYLREQIDSILCQKKVEVTLIIRDDGSTDRTLDILRGYESDPRVQVVIGEQNLRPARAFMHLLYQSGNYDYYAFADQDDIWLEDKLCSAVGMLAGESMPALYCSNQTLYRNGKSVGLRYQSISHPSMISVLFANHIAGCTMVMNRALAKTISQSTSRPKADILSFRMHDTWGMLAALGSGKVICDQSSHMLYRIHTANVVGVKGDKAGIVARLKLILKSIRQHDELNYRSKYAAEFLRCFPKISQHDYDVIELLATYRMSLWGRLRLMTSREICEQSGERTLFFVVKVLLGII